MYCQKCGKEFADDYSSCPWCGFPVPEEIHRAVEDVKADEPSPKSAVKIVAKENAAYFMNESNKKNFAAVTGPVYCLYRKCYGMFAKRFLIPLILIIAGVALLEVFGIFGIGLVIIGVGSVWFQISGYWLVRNFNAAYQKHCEEVAAIGDPKKYGTSKVAVVLYIAAIIAIIVAFAVLPEVLADGYYISFGATNGDDTHEPVSNTDHIVDIVCNGYLGEYTDATVKEMLEGVHIDLLGYDTVEWSSGASADNVEFVEVLFTSTEFDDAVFQFAMLDSKCFKVVYIEDPFWDLDIYMDKFTTLHDMYMNKLITLNSIYTNFYLSRHQSDEEYYELLARLDTLTGSAAEYGASKDYNGNRSTIYTKDDSALDYADEFHWSVSTLFSYYE